MYNRNSLSIVLAAWVSLATFSTSAQTPQITAQPQSQRTTVGSDVSFNVAVEPVFPLVSSGTLRLWLKANAGVITNSNGLVHQWQDQSGNANHAVQINTNLQPSLVYPAAIGNRAALRFDGVQSASVGDYLQGTGDVGLSNAYTSFMVYYIRDNSLVEELPAWIGGSGVWGAGRGYFISSKRLAFATWGHDFPTSFIIPTNTYRIWTDRFNTNQTLIEMFDSTLTTSTNFSLATSGQIAPAPGYFVGGLDPQQTPGRNFAGDIAELIYFRGSLSEGDRAAVETYLKQKYYQSSPSGAVSFQWQFGGTNIAGATNTSLTLTNVQLTDEGTYSAIASNSSGVTTSSNALLTFSAPPSIDTQPQSQEVVQGSNVLFSVTATGVFPLSYQWKFAGLEIANATGSSFSLTNVQLPNAGTYSVIVGDGITSVLSSNAVLSVNYAPTITVQPQSKTALTGTSNSLSVAATGSPLSYQWYFSSNAIAGQTNATLIFANVSTNDAGSYCVVVSNYLGSVTSSNAVLTVINTASAIFEDFEPGIHSNNWSSFSPIVVATNYGGFVSATHSLWFGGSGSRFAMTRPIDVSGGGTISFHLRLSGELIQNWDRVELPNEGVVLEYSVGGTNWVNIGTYNTSNYYTWTSVQPVIPAGAQTSNTRFRWRQLANSGSASDHWALDDIQILPAASAPSIVTQPQSRTVPVGTNVTLSVVAFGQAPLTYQWLLNSSNVLASTNASLTLTNVQLGDSGNYSVVISNSFGVVTSSNAVVTVLMPPSISAHPQSVSTIQGTNVTFSVTASGSAPLNYQWRINGVDLSNATDSSLSLTNIQGTNAGAYSVRVSNPVGQVISTSATLSIDTFPVISTQPQSQSVIAGTNVVFTVGINANLPVVPSGTLRLWLKADTGVMTNSSGLVNQWQDQSGNTNHASQNNTDLQPVLVKSSAIGGKPAVRFDGIQIASSGDFLEGTGDVAIPDAYTSFMVYSVNNANNVEKLPAWVGGSGNYGAGRGNFISDHRLAFATWGYDYPTSFVIPTNTYRIWTDRFNTNRSLIELFDRTSTTSTNFSIATSGQSPPISGYFVGGLNPSQTAGRNFGGEIAELIYFRGSLSEIDRLAVENYLKQKYYQSGSSGSVTYQWQFNGTNIVGATNSSLSLTNVQTVDAGNYSVIVSNTAGSVSSANAALTVNVPPSITTQPQNQNVNAGTSANFSVIAAGTAPFSYQWQKNGTNISGATNSALVLNAVQTSDAGNYRVVVASPFGSVTSSNAILAVNITRVSVVSTNATSAGSFDLAIAIAALGTENAVGFSLSFDPSILTFNSAVLDGAVSGAVLISNTAQVGSGKVGIAIALSANSTFAATTQTLAYVTFNVAVTTNALNTAVNFTDIPTTRQVSDVGAEILPALFVDGTVAIAAVDFEGDVAPRPNGSRTLTITDWVQVGRFVAGLDSPTNAAEFQRADCAPRADLGNGTLSITDWVQAGRYATGADPLTPVGGPSASSFASIKLKSAELRGVNRSVILQTTNEVGQTHSVSTRLIAQGNENAIGFSLAFDPAILTFTGATAGGNAPGALLNLNTNNLASGRVGVALSLSTGNKFTAGTQEVIKLTFVAQPNATGTTALTFVDSPILREVSDTNANSLATSFTSGSLVLSVPGPSLTIAQTGEGIVLSWPSSSTDFVLESSASAGGSWTNVTTSLTTNGGTINATFPVGDQPQFYRLKK